MGISRIYLWPSSRRRPRLLPPPHQFPCIEFRLMSATGETRFRSARPESRYCVPTVFYFPSSTSHIQSVSPTFLRVGPARVAATEHLVANFPSQQHFDTPNTKTLGQALTEIWPAFFRVQAIHHTRSCWLITPISLDLVTTAAAVVVVVIHRLRPAQYNKFNTTTNFAAFLYANTVIAEQFTVGTKKSTLNCTNGTCRN